MSNRKIRIISPITATVVLMLDIAVIGYGIFAVNKLLTDRTTAVIFFAAIEVIAVIIAALVTKEIFSNGVIFRDDEMEFLGLDDNNLFEYENIENVDAIKDETPSLTKNFLDRHAQLILTLKGDKVVSVDLGLCTKYTLEVIKKETMTRCNMTYVPPKKHKDIEANEDNDNNNE